LAGARRMNELVLERRMEKELAGVRLMNEGDRGRMRRNELVLELAGALGASGLLGPLYFASRQKAIPKQQMRAESPPEDPATIAARVSLSILPAG